MERNGNVVTTDNGKSYVFDSVKDAIDFIKCMEQEGSIIICLKRHHRKIYEPQPSKTPEHKM